MSVRQIQIKHPHLALLCAVLAMLWCAYVAFPSRLTGTCSTSGCLLFQDFRISGISLWWVGGAYFFLLTLLCLRNHHSLAWRLARLALFLDALLLIVMLFTAPCPDCLIIAVFFALTFFFLRPAVQSWFGETPPRPLILLPFWCGLFFSNSALALNENIPLWSIQAQPTAAIRIFFSPDCPHCHEAVRLFGSKAAFFPVAESPDDLKIIDKFQHLLNKGLSPAEAFHESLDPSLPVPPLPLGKQIYLRMQTMRNKASLLKQGFSSLPLILINGVPAGQPALEIFGEPTGAEEKAAPGNSLPDNPWNDTELNFCPQQSLERCS